MSRVIFRLRRTLKRIACAIMTMDFFTRAWKLQKPGRKGHYVVLITIIALICIMISLKDSAEWILSPQKYNSGGSQVLTADQRRNIFNISLRGCDNYLSSNPRKATKEGKALCPQRNISDLVGNLNPDLGVIPMDHVENIIFRKALPCADVSNERANEVVWHKTSISFGSHDWQMPAALEDEVSVGDYTYLPGGHWRPISCKPVWKVAILIPYRDRQFHLPILLRHLVPMLQKQRLEFAFYVIEQANTDLFNRAMLLNIGYKESLHFAQWDCYILHDVDRVPMNDKNYYGCDKMPRQFMTGSNRVFGNVDYIPYDHFFGGVSGLSRVQIETINGFSNQYWGWGSEDDDIQHRLEYHNFNLTTVEQDVGYYGQIRHHHQSAPMSWKRLILFLSFNSRLKTDGLSNLRYPKPEITLQTLYTKISVNIGHL